MFDPVGGPDSVRNQALAATTWTAQALWSGSPRKVFVQVVDASGVSIAWKLSTTSDGSAFVVDVAAGSALEFRPEPTRVYYLRASATGTAQALISED